MNNEKTACQCRIVSCGTDCIMKTRLKAKSNNSSIQTLEKMTTKTFYIDINMNEAIELACKGARWNAPFGAVIEKKGRIIGRGINHVASQHDPTAHAEIQAIRQACKKLGTTSLEGAIMYSSCEPCPMCKAALQWANIEKVHYGVSQKYADKMLGTRMNSRIVMTRNKHPDQEKPFDLMSLRSKNDYLYK